MLYFEKDLPFTFQRRILWWFCEFRLPRLCIRFFGLLSGYFEMHIVCGNVTKGAAIPHFDGGCRWGENRHGHLDFVLDFVLGFSCMGDGESTCAQICRAAAAASQEQIPPHCKNTKASAMCSELRLLQKRGRLL